MLPAEGRGLSLADLRGGNQQRQSSQIHRQQDIGISALLAISGHLIHQRIGHQVEVGLLLLLLRRQRLLGEGAELLVILILPIAQGTGALALVYVEGIREQDQAETHDLGEVREGIGQKGEGLALLVNVRVLRHVAGGGVQINLDIGGLEFLKGIGQEGESGLLLVGIVVRVVVDVLGHIGTRGIDHGHGVWHVLHLREALELVEEAAVLARDLGSVDHLHSLVLEDLLQVLDAQKLTV